MSPVSRRPRMSYIFNSNNTVNGPIRLKKNRSKRGYHPENYENACDIQFNVDSPLIQRTVNCEMNHPITAETNYDRTESNDCSIIDSTSPYMFDCSDTGSEPSSKSQDSDLPFQSSDEQEYLTESDSEDVQTIDLGDDEHFHPELSITKREVLFSILFHPETMCLSKPRLLLMYRVFCCFCFCLRASPSYKKVAL
ncbi:uncharacterized protein LOC129731885 [Wyeomyia smithii]|uniref:uncharacterized protein LOC129731885 n=1 Tax=Wyeomyia smithii TaxID=174621 RepID=UPI002467D00E|nr:uncharacterized protein LOC129731885 [Wyeomyia smithii]